MYANCVGSQPIMQRERERKREREKERERERERDWGKHLMLQSDSEKA